MDEEELSLLEQLAQNGFAKRTGFSPAQLSSQREIVNQRVKDANTPASYSLRDALMSAIVQATPGLIGAAIAGKRGAQAGLEGGLEGGKMFKQLTEDNFDAKRKTNSILAQEALQELQQMRKTNINAQETNLSNLDKKAFEDIKQKNREKIKGMGSSFERGMSQFSKALLQAQGGGELQAEEPSIEQASEEAKGVESVNLDVLSPEARRITLQDAASQLLPQGTDPKVIQSVADDMVVNYKAGAGVQRLLANAIANKRGEGALIEDATDRAVKQLELGEKQKQKSAEEKEVIAGSFVARPKKGEVLKTSPEEIEDLAANYFKVNSGFFELKQILKNATANELAGNNKEMNARLARVQENITEALIDVNGGKKGNTRATEKERNLIRNKLPTITGISAQFWDKAKRINPYSSPSIRQEIASFADNYENQAATDIANKGYEIRSDVKIHYNGSKPGRSDLIIKEYPDGTIEAGGKRGRKVRNAEGKIEIEWENE
jgi:hypothetical protein